MAVIMYIVCEVKDFVSSTCPRKRANGKIVIQFNLPRAGINIREYLEHVS